MVQGCITGISSTASVISPLVFTPLTGKHLSLSLLNTSKLTTDYVLHVLLTCFIPMPLPMSLAKDVIS
uniref:Uncharacterized protein n=1 Tax=Aegilops tauschii subsp. strangulata TaxID=200361 RepID=A0A452YSQ4_AEGTS